MSGADVCFDNSHHASNGCAHPLFYAVPREIILRINRVLQEPLVVGINPRFAELQDQRIRGLHRADGRRTYVIRCDLKPHGVVA